MSRDFHPLANILPLVEGAEFSGLVADILQHGLRDPIVLFENLILDGRNRYRASIAAGVEPRFKNYEGDDPLAFVISANLKRRHLDASQRSMVAATLANIEGPGQPKKNPANLPNTSQAAAAAMLHVSERSVRDAVRVKHAGEPEIVHAVEQGKLAVSDAAKAAALAPELQREIAAQAAAGDTRIVRHLVTKETRARLERDLGAKQLALPNKRYGVVYADPPWAWTAYSERGLHSSPEMHYPTMSVEEIAAFDIASIAADDAVLFMWTTAPHLANAVAIMAAWGFTYKSNCVWSKDKAGLGYWFRSAHEQILVGARGNISAPAQGTQARSVINADVGRHSEKPAAFLEMIEAYYPSLPKIELFARGAGRLGWSVWGNEAE